MESDQDFILPDSSLVYEDYESIKISKALPFEIEFESEELEHKHKYGMQMESASELNFVQYNTNISQTQTLYFLNIFRGTRMTCIEMFVPVQTFHY